MRYKTHGDQTAYSRTGSAGCLPQSGLTKREFFAALALQGAISNSFTMNHLVESGITNKSVKELVGSFVEFADLLIEELNKDENNN